jgi:hypothetical protein
MNKFYKLFPDLVEKIHSNFYFSVNLFSFNQNELWTNLEIKQLFYTTNPVFYTSGNRFVRRTGTFGNLIFSLVPSGNRNSRSTCRTLTNLSRNLRNALMNGNINIRNIRTRITPEQTCKNYRISICRQF